MWPVVKMWVKLRAQALQTPKFAAKFALKASKSLELQRYWSSIASRRVSFDTIETEKFLLCSNWLFLRSPKLLNARSRSASAACVWPLLSYGAAVSGFRMGLSHSNGNHCKQIVRKGLHSDGSKLLFLRKKEGYNCTYMDNYFILASLLTLASVRVFACPREAPVCLGREVGCCGVCWKRSGCCWVRCLLVQ